MSGSRALLRRFQGKGGLMGVMAGKYAQSAPKSSQFLNELKVQLRTNRSRMEGIWGKDLISDLDRFQD